MWEADALTQRLNGWLQPLASVACASLEIRGVRFTCTAPTSWPPLQGHLCYVTTYWLLEIHFHENQTMSHPLYIPRNSEKNINTDKHS